VIVSFARTILPRVPFRFDLSRFVCEWVARVRRPACAFAPPNVRLVVIRYCARARSDDADKD
jgi:hypothetical protein